MSDGRALEGITVVAVEHAVAAPLCTRSLADMGARIIKIERPEGGDFARGYDTVMNGMSSFFVWLNRGKESLTLDLKQEPARKILMRLIGDADVLVQNLAPGAAARLGLSYEALAPAHEKIIVCDISGYGDAGPMVDKKAYDLLIQAESGIISVTGTPEQPSRVGVSVADIATGMNAHAAVLAALVRRGRTGRGARVSVAMLDALAEWMTYPLYRALYSDSLPERHATTHPIVAPYGAHRVADGEVIFGLQNDREWSRFCAEVMDDPLLASDPRFLTNPARCANRAALTEAIEARLSTLTVAETVALLDRAGIANGRLNDAYALAAHEQFLARDRWRETGTEAGRFKALLPAITFSDVEAAMGDVPSLGQHTDAILTGLGYDADAIAALRAAHAV